MKANKQLYKAMAQPWAIRPASMAVMMDATVYAETIELPLPEEKPDVPYDLQDGVAVISVSGVIGKGIPKIIAQMFGMVDVDEIGVAVKAANADPAVKSIMLDIDSPGGTVTGVPEVAQAIRDSVKPTYAFTDNLMASAAYWLAAGASGVFASESALVGSIGVFIPMMDMRRAYEMAGLEMEVIKTGTYKAAGYPGTSLTDEQRADLQASVNHLFGKFAGFVGSRIGANGAPDEDSMQGQDFYGDQALSAGLVDGITSRGALMGLLKKLQEY